MTTTSDRQLVETIISELEQAWNSGDAQRFASVFAQDGQQINIFGAQFDGAGAIAEQHARVFATMFRGSINRLQIVDLRSAGTEVLIARISSAVDVPHGPLQGMLQTIGSLVILKNSARPEVLLFHNTRVPNAPALNR